MKGKLICCAVVAALSCGFATAAEVHVAVAANFTAPSKDLAPIFEQKTGHKLVLSFGSTGRVYGQQDPGQGPPGRLWR